MQYNIGFVLSGGGARGFAHLGFLQALNDAGIYPDVIAGTSAGALAGVLYADGYTPREILEFMDTGKRLDFLRPTMPRESLLQMTGIIRILTSKLRAKRFEELRIPLFVTATDINNAHAVYFSEGELLTPIIASASIPVLFPPVRIGEFLYVDGGILDNLPVKPLENICRLKMGSFVHQVGYRDKVSGLINIAERTLMLSMSKEQEQKRNKFDLFVAPEEIQNFKILDTLKAAELFDLGYNETKRKLGEFDKKRLVAD